MRDLEELGTGEQQVLALAFANAYAEAFHTGVLLVVEEPEAHLHPLAQEALARWLRTRTAAGVQVVLTTHSPFFLDILGLEGLVVVKKAPDGPTTAVQLDKASLVARLHATGAPEDRVTEANVLPFYKSCVTREVLEGFFAKLVVLVEGPCKFLRSVKRGSALNHCPCHAISETSIATVPAASRLAHDLPANRGATQQGGLQGPDTLGMRNVCRR